MKRGETTHAVEAMSPSDTPRRAAREEGGGEPLPPGAPRPYRAPHLTAYGRLADLTRFGGSEVNDSGSGLGPLP